MKDNETTKMNDEQKSMKYQPRTALPKDPEILEQQYGKSDVRTIMAKLLKALKMNMSQFSKETGFAYMRVFDLQRGRVQKFSPDAVAATCDRFPQVSRTFLYTGDGPVFSTNNIPSTDDSLNPLPSALLTQLMEKDKRLDEKEQMLLELERKLMARELEIVKREAELGLPHKKGNVG